MVLLFLLLVIALFTLPSFMCHLFLMCLSFTCSSFLSARLLIMVVVSFLIIILVLFMIIALGPRLVLDAGYVIHLIFGSLTNSSFHFTLLDSYY
jgi:hypothetical protein